MQLVMLSGGVGGARMARGLVATPEAEITVVVNVADDDLIHGVHVAADLDTVVYTLAGVEGPSGWGRADETWHVMDELERFPGADTSFRLGDRDLALNLYRTGRLAAGDPLSTITTEICRTLGVGARVLPATDDRVRTRVLVADGELDFQTYFVRRRHRDEILGIEYSGIDDAKPAPGVIEAIATADIVIIGPSNPVLSVWPILGIPGITEAIERRRPVAAVSPLISGRAVKGPAVEAMRSAGLGADLQGVVDAYRGLVTHLVIDDTDTTPLPDGVGLLRTNTMIEEPEAASRLAAEIMEWLT